VRWQIDDNELNSIHSARESNADGTKACNSQVGLPAKHTHGIASFGARLSAGAVRVCETPGGAGCAADMHEPGTVCR